MALEGVHVLPAALLEALTNDVRLRSGACRRLNTLNIGAAAGVAA